MKPEVAKQLLTRYQDESWYNRLHIYIRLRRAFFDKIEPFVSKKGKVLDYGCGHGFFSFYLFDKSRNRTITAVDISKRKIAIAKHGLRKENIAFTSERKVLDLQRKNAYDTICILNVLYLVNRKKKEEIIGKAYGSLKRGGRLIISELDAASSLMIFLTIVREFIMVNVLHATKGATIVFESDKWWQEELNKRFKKVIVKNFMTNGYQKLYVCDK